MKDDAVMPEGEGLDEVESFRYLYVVQWTHELGQRLT